VKLRNNLVTTITKTLFFRVKILGGGNIRESKFKFDK